MDAGPYLEIPVRLCFLLIVMLLSFFLNLSRTAYVSANDNKIEKLAEKGKKGAQRIVRLAQQDGAVVLACLKGADALCGFIFVAFGNAAFSRRIASGLFGVLGKKVPFGFLLCCIILLLTVIALFFYNVVCQLMAKKLAMQRCEKNAVQFSGVVVFVVACMKPLVCAERFLANRFIRLFGLDPKADEERITEEEIRMLVDEGEEKGVLEDTQREMINNIFEFDDLNAGDIMTHRTEIEAVNSEDELQEVVRLAIEVGCSRIPVYEEDLDNIIGIIYVKDLLQFIGAKITKTGLLKQLLRPAYFVPETMQCGKLFAQMTEKRIQMAIVVDEYGGTAGMVTMEDLLESIVGNIQDEYDNEDEEVTQIDEATYTFGGMTDIEELENVLDIELPEGDYDTVAGLMLSLLGYVPDDGHTPTIIYHACEFSALRIVDQRIEKVQVRICDKGTTPIQQEK